MEPNKEEITKTEWEFDNYSHQHWDEIKAGKVDKTLSLVRVTNEQEGLGSDTLTIIANQKPELQIRADRDQWGTWITFSIGDAHFTIAQEDQTKSFMSALIAGLTKLKEITDFETEEPTVTMGWNSETSG